MYTVRVAGIPLKSKSNRLFFLLNSSQWCVCVLEPESSKRNSRIRPHVLLLKVSWLVWSQRWWLKPSEFPPDEVSDCTNSFVFLHASAHSHRYLSQLCLVFKSTLPTTSWWTDEMAQRLLLLSSSCWHESSVSASRTSWSCSSNVVWGYTLRLVTTVWRSLWTSSSDDWRACSVVVEMHMWCNTLLSHAVDAEWCTNRGSKEDKTIKMSWMSNQGLQTQRPPVGGAECRSSQSTF